MSVELEFKPISEPWALYELQDGTIIKIRPIMTCIADNGRKDLRGRPIYDFEIQTVSRVIFKEKNKEGLA